MVAAGLISVGLNVTLETEQFSIDKDLETRNKIRTISDRVELFLIENGRLPCPASLTQKPGESDSGFHFGEEIRNTTSPYDCNHITNAGIIDTTNHYRGAVPITTLGLQHDFMADGWDQKIEYVVFKGLQTSNDEGEATNYTSDTSPLLTLDSNTEVSYILISHSTDKRGAYPNGGASANATTGATTQELENLDDDDVFNDNIGDIIQGFTINDIKEEIDEFCQLSDESSCDPSTVAGSNNSFCNTEISGCLTFGRPATWVNNHYVPVSDKILVNTGGVVRFDLDDYNFINGKTYIIQFTIDNMDIPDSRVRLRYRYQDGNGSNRNFNLIRFSTGLSADYTAADIGTTVQYEWTPGATLEGEIASNPTLCDADPLRCEENPNRFFFARNASPTSGTLELELSNVKIFPKRTGKFGALNYDIFESITGKNVVDLTSSLDYPNNPTESSDTAIGINGDIPTSPGDGIKNYGGNYGTRIWGYFTPDVDGFYKLFQKADDSAQLFFNPSDVAVDDGGDEGNKTLLIDYVDGSNNWLEANCSTITSLIDGETLTCGGTGNEFFNLKGGVSYFIEILHKAGNKGADNVFLDYQVSTSNQQTFPPDTFLSTMPACLINEPPACSSYYEVDAALSPFSSLQTADVITMDNSQVIRFVKIEILDTHGATDYSGLGEIRFRNATGLISTSGIRIFRYHDFERFGGSLTSLHPYRLFSETGITDANAETYSITATSNPLNQIWSFGIDRPSPYYVIFDLGKNYQLEDILIWNMNQSGFTTRGAQNIRVYASSDPYFVMYEPD